MARSKVVSLRECFSVVRDPRREHQRFHHLWDIIAITICAVLSGADCWPDIEEYGQCKQEWLESFLELPFGIPSHDTFARVFALLDPLAFQEGFRNWVQALVEATDGRVVAIDGKTLRHSFDKAKGKGALHLVGAWAAENNLILGQQAVDCKSNEITAIPKLLEILDLTGAIVTIDAMGCQKEIAAKIIAKGSDYVLALKGNQENLHKDVEKLFCEGLENNFAGLEHHTYRTTDQGHGRNETRLYYVVDIPKELAERYAEWKDLKTLGMVLCERQVGNATPTIEKRFYICSIDAKVKTFARAVRGHWGIENNLHWVLDVSFHEDASRLRTGHGPENLALVRRLAASLLQKEKTAKQGVAGKRKKAGWDDDYLLRVLGKALL
jgi:predicted transposase YbfD/YdcC